MQAVATLLPALSVLAQAGADLSPQTQNQNQTQTQTQTISQTQTQTEHQNQTQTDDEKSALQILSELGDHGVKIEHSLTTVSTEDDDNILIAPASPSHNQNKRYREHTPDSPAQQPKKFKVEQAISSGSAIDEAVNEFRITLKHSVNQAVEEFRKKLETQVDATPCVSKSSLIGEEIPKKKRYKRPPQRLSKKEKQLCHAFTAYLAECKLEKHETREETLTRLKTEALQQGIKLILNPSTMSKMTKLQKCVKDPATVKFFNAQFGIVRD